MTWNWQLKDWPNFTWDKKALVRAESLFLENAGILIGTTNQLNDDLQKELRVALLSSDALDTSEIEGEILDRESVQSSIKRQLGLNKDIRRIPPNEAGVSEMMIDAYLNLSSPLSHQTLFNWHKMLMKGRQNIETIGGYRKHKEAMQIVSGPAYNTKIFFQAPPSDEVKKLMQDFIVWFNKSKLSLPGLTRAGIAHVWFESIHPFEDGNGRIGRAISEKALAQASEKPVFTALSPTLLKHQKGYYKALQGINETLDLTDWLIWFSTIVIEAQKNCQSLVEFIIEKSKLMERLSGTINSRQEKALLRMLREGPQGFKGGMSASKYMKITGASIATTTRDLRDLVNQDALSKTGERKSARYHLKIKPWVDLPQKILL